MNAHVLSRGAAYFPIEKANTATAEAYSFDPSFPRITVIDAAGKSYSVCFPALCVL